MRQTIEISARRCLALYSGGLDSIVCVKLLEAQGIEVLPLFFATPFFGFEALLDPETFRQGHRHKFGIDPRIVDYTDSFIEILAAPAHGYGKHFNPCIDCKIGMLKAAKTMLADLGAAFIATGEVVGQRPMSQRRDAMNVIEREAGLKDILLRPLCAPSLKPTRPENDGIVRRADLPAITGRGRHKQEELAHQFGITDIPNPAGGCLLTYEQSALKVRHTFRRFAPGLPTRADLILDVLGRKFMLDDTTAVAVARDESEGERMERQVYPGNIFVWLMDVPGPLGILRGDARHLDKAAGLCLRYSKARGQTGIRAAWGYAPASVAGSLTAPVLEEDVIRAYLQAAHPPYERG